MGGLIPQSFIDEILSRVDIVDVIHERVPLRKAGRNYQALCPFHSEKTPSFTVNRDKQFYYCFGCGAHGSAIGFLMDAARLSFIEAVQELASQVGLQLPSTDRSGLSNPPQTQIYETLQSAAHFYAIQLRKHPSAPGAAWGR